MSRVRTHYDEDFYAWTQAQAALLRQAKASDLDWENLAEEIESVGISQRNKVQSHCRRLLQHLLKWRYQPTQRSRSWRRTIITQRLDIATEVGDRGTLRQQLPLLLQAAYPGARRLAETETGLPLATFPATCPWTPAQVLDEDFWPEGDPSDGR